MTQGVLTVYMRAARGLMAADSNGLSDPYVVAKLCGQRKKTHVIKGTLNPAWGLKLDFEHVALEDVVAQGLRLDVYDYDMLSRDDPLGGLDVSLGELGGKKKVCVFNEALPTKGTLEFTVTWEELPARMTTSGTLEIVLEGATDLISADANGLSDPYARISLGDVRHKSKVAKRTLSPVWGETFAFKGTLRELTAKRMRVEIFDHDTFSKDDPLGSADIGLAALELIDEKIFRAGLATSKSRRGEVQLKARWVADAAGGAANGGAANGGDPSEQVVEHGTLKMRIGTLAGWKQRYFELGEEDLAYYASDKDTSRALGVLPFACIEKIAPSTSDPKRFTLKLAHLSRSLKHHASGSPPPPQPSSSSLPSGTPAATPRTSSASSTTADGLPHHHEGPQVTLKALDLSAPDGPTRDRWVRSIQLLTDAALADASLRASMRTSQAEAGWQSGRASALSSANGGSDRYSSTAPAGGGGGDPETDGNLGAGFGHPIERLTLIEEGATGLRVPAALSLLWGELARRPPAEGLASEGIFRLSAPADEVNSVKDGLERGGAVRDTLTAASSQCLAALIKKFMRELPDDLWADVRPHISQLDREGVLADGGADDGDEAAADEVHATVQALVHTIPDAPYADLVVWVCDVMARVLTHEEDNRMNVGAIATVFAPGLVHPPPTATDPGAFMVWSQIGNNLTAMLVRAHSRKRLTPAAPGAADEAGAAAPVDVTDDAADGAGAAPRKSRSRRSVEDQMDGLQALLKEMSASDALAPRPRVSES